MVGALIRFTLYDDCGVISYNAVGIIEKEMYINGKVGWAIVRCIGKYEYFGTRSVTIY